MCVCVGGAGEGAAGRDTPALGLAVAACGVAQDGWNMGLALQLERDECGKRRQQLDHERPLMLQSLNYIL